VTREPAQAGQRPRAQRQTYATGNALTPGEPCDRPTERSALLRPAGPHG
jgi:hypothetical protein